jgi:hypothetical protein
VSPAYYFEGPFGPMSNVKPIQGMPAAPPCAAPFYNMPYIYYPAPLPAYPQNYPYPSPIVSQPTIAVSTLQPPVLVTATFPSLPVPKPVVNKLKVIVQVNFNF